METGGGGASGGSYKWNRKGIIARMAGLPAPPDNSLEQLSVNIFTFIELGTNRGQITLPPIR